MSNKNNMEETISKLIDVSLIHREYSKLGDDTWGKISELRYSKESESNEIDHLKYKIRETADKYQKSEVKTMQQPRKLSCWNNVMPEYTEHKFKNPQKDLLYTALGPFSIIAFLLISSLSSIPILGLLFVPIGFVSLFPFVKLIMDTENARSLLQWCLSRKEDDAKLAEWEKKFNDLVKKDDMDSYYSECKKNYDAYGASIKAFNEENEALRKDFLEKKQKLIEEAKASVQAVRESNENIDKEISDIEAAWDKKRHELFEQMQKVGVLDASFYHLSGKIADLLSTGRADTLKEAINIAVEEEHRAEREREEDDRREREAHRQAEENRRHNAAMEAAARDQAYAESQRAADARRHNEAMERAARDQAYRDKQKAEETRRHNQAMERIARDNARR